MKVEIRAKAVEAFANTDTDLVTQKIAPYCDAPQVTTNGDAVIQRFDKESALKLVNAFQSNARRLLSRLGFGSAKLPVYNGHPDHAGIGDEPTDTNVYATVNSLEAREDGLWATIEKTPLLATLKNALGRLEISPRWNCVKANDGTFKPEKLLSLGLVVHGNLPNACTINSLQTGKETPMTDEQIQTLAEALGVEKTFDAILTAVNASKTASSEKEDETLAPDASDAPTGTPEGSNGVSAETDAPVAEEKPAESADPAPEATEAPATEESAPETADPEPMANEATEPDPRDAEIDALKAEIATLKNERQANCDEVLKTALSNGQITPAQKEQAQALLNADFVNAKAFIEALPLAGTFSNGTQAVAQALEAVATEPVDEKTDAARKFYDLVNSKIDKANGIDVSLAYKLVAASKEGSALWKQMNA